MLGLSVLAAATAIGTVLWQHQERQRSFATEETGGNPEAGHAALIRFGCGGCHRISGVAAARGRVGPSLAGLSGRTYLAGRLPNEPAQLIRWIREPRAVDPQTAMPDLGVEERDARDMAAYLYSLKPTSQ
ncbi:c-type cytochrome [Sabulicella rubraurantiaca]|uniref:c-type cytochrome n=1 Tax=Sabulicella rubraurantiaca TaxID=2811429 RepID=UPI001F3B155B|nr:c-type cytochrome [Sabulicella rubraurantiaca]